MCNEKTNEEVKDEEEAEKTGNDWITADVCARRVISERVTCTQIGGFFSVVVVARRPRAARHLLPAAAAREERDFIHKSARRFTIRARAAGDSRVSSLALLAGIWGKRRGYKAAPI